MLTDTRRKTHGRLTRPDNDYLPDGTGGTVTGGPRAPINLLEILSRSSRGATRGGAVSGAAQSMASVPGGRARADRAFALSDGSRITFASVDNTDARVLLDV